MKIMDIQKLLGQNREISGFRIVSTKTDSYELFFVHRRLETVRATDTDTVSVTVYVNHDGKVGDSTFSVYGSMGEAEVADRIAAAAERARLVFNEPYELPEGGVSECGIQIRLPIWLMCDREDGGVLTVTLTAECEQEIGRAQATPDAEFLQLRPPAGEGTTADD